MTPVIPRRNFLLSSMAVLSLPKQLAHSAEPLVFGMTTDAHYADADTRGSRYYRDSIPKMRECVEFMNGQNIEFLVELGDLKDENSPVKEEETLRFLETIETEFAKFRGPRYHVLGNHDMDSISKPQFLKRVVNTGIDPKRSYYSFDRGGIHFIVLDANFTSDGKPYDRGKFDWTDANIPNEEMQWLKEDLADNKKPVIVFTHQLLDGEGSVYINNADEVRTVLEKSGKVLVVFQGHHHEGQYNEINGIHYYTLKAMVEGPGLENGSYAVVELQQNRLTIKGYRKAVSRDFTV